MSAFKLNPSYGFLLLIVISISLQFDYLFFNIYFFVPFLVVVSIFLFTLLMPIKSTNHIIFLFLFLLILLFTTFAISLSSAPEFKRTLVYPIYVILSFFVINKVLYKINKTQVEKLIRLTLYLCIFSVAIETFFRFYMPTLDLRNDNIDYIARVVSESPSFKEIISNQYFYAYKFSSIMFFDSNFVGLFLLPILILNLFYIEISRKLIFKILLIVVLFLIFLTFSRSAIITATIVIYIYSMYIVMRWNKQFFFISLFLTFFLFSIGLFYLYTALIQDGSLKTKLGIFSSLNAIFENDLINIFFGYGVETGGTVYSYKEGAYAHALIPLLLGQFGLIGLIAYFSLLIYLSFKIGFYGWLLFFTIFTSGLSLADPWQILNYFSFLIMAHHTSFNKKQVLYEY